MTAARAHLPSLPLYLSFIPPNDEAVPAFVAGLVAAGAGRLVIDQHWYLNWASPPGSPLGWEEMHRRACSEAAQTWRSTPVHDFASHGADSCRYMALGVRELQPPRVVQDTADSWERAWRAQSQRDKAPTWRVA